MIYVMGRQSPASQEEETVPQITKNRYSSSFIFRRQLKSSFSRFTYGTGVYLSSMNLQESITCQTSTLAL